MPSCNHLYRPVDAPHNGGTILKCEICGERLVIVGGREIEPPRKG